MTVTVKTRLKSCYLTFFLLVTTVTKAPLLRLLTNFIHRILSIVTRQHMKLSSKTTLMNRKKRRTKNLPVRLIKMNTKTMNNFIGDEDEYDYDCETIPRLELL